MKKQYTCEATVLPSIALDDGGSFYITANDELEVILVGFRICGVHDSVACVALAKLSVSSVLVIQVEVHSIVSPRINSIVRDSEGALSLYCSSGEKFPSPPCSICKFIIIQSSIAVE